MRFTLAEIAAATGLAHAGDAGLVLSGLSEPSAAGPEDLALAMSPKFAGALEAGGARAAVLWPDADWQGLGLAGALFAPRARLALAGLTEAFAHPFDLAPGIHASAVIDPSASLGADCWIGPFAFVGPGARIGDKARIASHVTIGAEAEIGPGSQLHPGVRIGARCRIGARFIAHGNAVIGADGFSFVTPERGSVESAKEDGRVAEATRNTALVRIHSLAAVEIGDDVEIGALTSIDRGTVAPTRIGDGTKIDNQVQIGHNVRVGSNCLLCAQTGIAGSAEIGDRVVLGGKSGIADHASIGSDTVCAAGSLVPGNVAPRSVLMGAPAHDRRVALQQFAAIRHLPRMVETVREIQKKLGL